jgi:dipeptidyl aminopeptidase/acylaminoacyl peptidase
MAMMSALQRNGIKTELVKVEGAGHGFGPVSRQLVLARVVAFLDGVLK